VLFIRSQFKSSDFIPLHQPCFKGNEKKYLIDTIDSSFVSTIGNYVNQFEESVAKYTGSKYAIATVNGTAALHIALLTAGVGQNDEVITQSLTFVATCNAISYCGAESVFVDIDKDDLGMSPDSLLDFLELYAELRNDGLCWNKKTNRVIRACVPVHSFGHPVKIFKIKEICDKFNIQLVEDAAESLGSYVNKTHTGKFGISAAISFNGNKIVTTGGGGMIITDNKLVAEKAKHITTTAKKKHPWLFIHDQIGYNYRLPNLNAALGVAQMEVLDEYIDKKRELANNYMSWFSNTNYKFVTESSQSRSNYWLNSFLADNREDRDRLLKYTNMNNIMTRPAWTPMHTLKMFKGNLRTDLSNTEWIENRLVNIPSSVIL